MLVWMGLRTGRRRFCWCDMNYKNTSAFWTQGHFSTLTRASGCGGFRLWRQLHSGAQRWQHLAKKTSLWKLFPPSSSSSSSRWKRGGKKIKNIQQMLNRFGNAERFFHTLPPEALAWGLPFCFFFFSWQTQENFRVKNKTSPPCLCTDQPSKNNRWRPNL